MKQFIRFIAVVMFAFLAVVLVQPVTAQEDPPPDYTIDIRGSNGTGTAVTAAATGDDVYGQVRIWEDRMRIAVDIVNPIGAQVDWRFVGKKERSGSTNISQQVMDANDAFRYGQPFYLYLWINGTPLYTSQFIVPDVNYGPIWSWLRLSDVNGECVRGEGQTDPDSIWTVTDSSGNKLEEYQFHLGDDEWSTPWMPLSVDGPPTVNIEAKFYTANVLRTTAKFTNVPNLCYRPTPDIEIEKSTDTPMVHAGQEIRWTLLVTSTGNTVAHSVQVSDPLPMAAGFSWSVVEGPDGACSITENVLNCSLGDMAAGETRKIVLRSPTEEQTVPMCGNPMDVNNVGYVQSTDGGQDQDDAFMQIFCNPKPEWAALRGTLVVYKNTGNTLLTSGQIGIPDTNCVAQFDKLEPGDVGSFFCGEIPLVGSAKYGKADVAPVLGVLPENWEVIHVPTTVYTPADPIVTAITNTEYLTQCSFLPAVSR